MSAYSSPERSGDRKLSAAVHVPGRIHPRSILGRPFKTGGSVRLSTRSSCGEFLPSSSAASLLCRQHYVAGSLAQTAKAHMTALIFRMQRVISMWFANELMQDRLKSSRNPFFPTASFKTCGSKVFVFKPALFLRSIAHLIFDFMRLSEGLKASGRPGRHGRRWLIHRRKLFDIFSI